MKREVKGRDTKESILRSATECFTEIGYHQTDVNQICEKAKITKGAFYYHFSSKQDLFIDLLEKWIESVAQHLNASSKDSSDMLDLISSIPGNFSPVFKNTGKQLPVFLEIYVKSILNKDLKKNILGAYDRFIEFFSDAIEKGIEDGSIRKDINVDEVAKILFSLCIGMIMQGLLVPEGDDWVGLTRKSLLMLLS